MAAFLTLLLFYFFTPPIVSFDGKLYLASGKSLNSLEEMKSFYHWIREPMYPMLIFVSLKISGLQLLFFIQMILASLGIALTLHSWLQLSARIWAKQYQLLAVVLSSALIHGYTTSVLQVSLFILLIGGMTNLVHNVFICSYSRKVVFLKVFSISIYAALLSLNAALTILIFVFLIYLFSQERKLLQKCLLVSLFSIALVLTSWNQVKATVNTGESVFRGVESPSEGIKLFLIPGNLGANLEKIQQSPFSLLGLAPDRFDGLTFQQLSFEQRIYGLPLFDENIRCGKFDPSIPEIDSYVSNTLILGRCLGDDSRNFLNVVNFALGKLLPLIGIFFIVILLTFRKLVFDNRIALLAPISLLLPYMALGAANSRYGAPVLIFGVISMFECIINIREKKI
jgi:hypothetical protein